MGVIRNNYVRLAHYLVYSVIMHIYVNHVILVYIITRPVFQHVLKVAYIISQLINVTNAQIIVWLVQFC